MTPDGHFWLSCALTAAALVWLLVRADASRPSFGQCLDAEVAGVIFLTMFAWRWPAMGSLIDFNPDESQLAAGAITLLHDPVYWRAVDGTTSGPINFYALVPFLALDFLPPVFAVRLGGLVFLWSALALTFVFLRRTCGTPAAILGLLPAWLFVSLATDWDFIHCSSEQVSLPLTAGAVLLLWEASRADALPSGWRWNMSALCAGSLPWAKLQSAPLAATLAAAAVVVVIRAPSATVSPRLRAIVAYAAWSLAPAVAFIGMAMLSGQLRHLHESYVVNNLLYASVRTDVGAAVAGLIQQAGVTGFFPAFLAATLACALVGALSAVAGRYRPDQLFVFGLLGVAVAGYGILKPALPAPHYLFYLVLPCTWLATAGIKQAREAWPRLEAAFMFLVMFGAAFLPGLLRLSLDPPDASVFSPRRQVPDDERLVRIISAFATKEDSLAVWGWAPRLNAGSRLAQGTRDGNAARQIQLSDKRDSYYRPRFIEDMRRNRPAIFVDAVGPGRFDFRRREHQAHDAFADIATLVRENYTFVGDYYNARLYLRSDLTAARPDAIRRLEAELRESIADGSAQWDWPLPGPAFPTRHHYGRHAWHLQTPAEYAFLLRGGEKYFFFTFGLDPRCYVQGTTDGAELRIELRMPNLAPQLVFHRTLDPRSIAADRGIQRGRVLLPAAIPPGTQLVVRALPGARGDMSWDWVFFAEPRFARAIEWPAAR